MKTKIINTLQQWVPEAFQWFPQIQDLESPMADYRVLRALGEACIRRMGSGNPSDQEKIMEIARVVNLLYVSGNQFTRNAIENEFLMGFLEQESPASLKWHISLLPVELRRGYIKTLLGNQFLGLGSVDLKCQA